MGNGIIKEEFFMKNHGLLKKIRKHIEQLKGTGKTLKSVGLDESKFDADQLKIIREGLYKGLDVSKYADPKYNCDQMFQIYRGLEDNIDVNYYANPEFNSLQMDLIRYGIYNGLDVSKYADPKYSYEQMVKIHCNLEKEIQETLEINKLNKMKNILEQLMNEDYKSFTKAIISIEEGVEDNKILNEIYDRRGGKIFYNNLSDIEHLGYSLEEKENSEGYIPPEAFQEEDINERFVELKSEIVDDWEPEL